MQALRAFPALVLLSAVLCAGAARAQQTITECADINHAIFTAQDLQALDKAAKLSAAQKESIESLMREALSRARQEYGEMLHECEQRNQAIYQAAAEDTSNPDAYKVARTKYLSAYVTLEAAASKKIAAIEREALGDIRTALTSEQASAGWAAFERSRRRLVLEQRGWGADQGRNPRSLVQGAKLSSDDVAAAEPVLARYELDIDPLLTKRMEGLIRMNKETLEKAHSEEVDYKVLREMWKSPDLNTAEIKRLNVRAAIAVEKTLSDEGKQQFLRQRIGLEVSDEISRPAADERVRPIVKLKSLSPKQADEIHDLIEQADKAVFQMAITELRARDEAALRSEAPTEEQARAHSAETSKQYTTRLTTLVKALRGLLTSEQRAEVDLFHYNRDGGDPFKAARKVEEESQWNITPEKAEEQLRKLRGW
jgi:hypothetical protein